MGNDSKKPQKKSLIKEIILVGSLTTLLVLFLTIPGSDSSRVEQFFNDSDLSPANSIAGDYLSARYAERKGLHKEALDYYGSALSKSPNNIALIERSTIRLVLDGNISGAIILADRMVEQLQKDETYSDEERTRKTRVSSVIKAIDHVKNGRFDEAITAVKPYLLTSKNVSIAPTLQDTLPNVISAWALVGKQQNKQAIITLNDAKNSMPEAFYHYQSAMLHAIDGNLDQAIKDFETIPAQNQSFRSAIALNHTYLAQGSTQKAKQTVVTFKEHHPQFRFGEQEEQNFLERSTSDLPRHAIAEVLEELASYLASQRYVEQSRVLLHLALHLAPNDAYARYMLASTLQDMKQNDAALEMFKTISKKSGFYQNAEIQKAIILYRKGNKEAAKEKFLLLADKDKSDIQSLLNLADLLLRDEEHDDAIKLYTRVLDRIEKQEGKIAEAYWSIYYARGIAYEQTNQWDSAEKDFLEALKLSPDQPDVLNYLGYSWLIAGTHLEKAESMLKIAIKQRPRDAHILDSYGWALFKLSRYKEAMHFLERANLLMPEEPTINDHLGDLYWKIGRRTEARFQWERALLFKPTEKETAAIEAKLKHGLDPDIANLQDSVTYTD